MFKFSTSLIKPNKTNYFKMVSTMYLTWSSFNNIRLLVMACKPIIIFYLIWLVNTSERIRSEEGSLLDLVCWPDGNAIPVIVACVGIIAVIIQIYGLYQLFKAGLPKWEYNVTNGLFYYIWALIIIIIIFLAIMFYSGLQTTIIRARGLILRPLEINSIQDSLEVTDVPYCNTVHFKSLYLSRVTQELGSRIFAAKIKGGITKAMLLYSSHLPSKVAIDQLQTRFHCCGRVHYQEWFYISWYTTGASGTLDDPILSSPQTSHKFVGDNVPYSCCSMDALQPCIHHRVTHKESVYKYNPQEKLTIWKDGCEEKLINEMMTISWRFNAVMALISAAMVLQGVGVRYLHTAYRSGLHSGNQVRCEAYLLRSVGATDSKQINYPKRRVFRKRKLHQARTLQWVRASIRGPHPRKIMCRPSTATDNSSDELLKPID